MNSWTWIHVLVVFAIGYFVALYWPAPGLKIKSAIGL